MTDSLQDVRRVANAELDRLREEHPEQFEKGGTLLLGKHYAHEKRGILMLGLNPGASKGPQEFYVDRYTSNLLLPGGPNERFSYWRNARTLFAATTPLLTAMETATFSFCCPFRTSTWSNLPRQKRDALIQHSRPILTQVLQDCVPRLVIVAGVAGLDALRTIAAPRLTIGSMVSDGGDPSATYQWRAYRATFDESEVVVAQIPHLSRANSRAKLQSCGSWLSDLVATAS